jgi:hypothetical protein
MSALDQRSFARIVVALALSLGAATAHAELIAVSWDAQGRFEHNAVVPATKFLELCTRLSRGQRIDWRFDGERPTDFNIHYHVDAKQVVYPVKRAAVAALAGTLEAPLDQDYCWMWSNRSDRPLSLRVLLTR